VIDGDTIKIGDEIIRLEGIDAPETEQHCFGPGGSYECGKQATKALTALINDMTPDGFVPAGVGCEITGRDRHNRLLGLCSVAKEPVNGRGPGDWVTGELNKKMVEGGWALAFVKYSDRYLPQQKRAEALKFGMWAGTFDEPWDYRRHC
jgi:endonuclease YncB( thermonuclease family)